MFQFRNLILITGLAFSSNALSQSNSERSLRSGWEASSHTCSSTSSGPSSSITEDEQRRYKKAQNERLLYELTSNGYNFEKVEELLKNGARFGYVDYRGFNALHKAAERRSYFNLLKLVLKYADRSDVNKQTKEGNTLLHIAIQHSYYEAIELLVVMNETNLSLKNNEGLTAEAYAKEKAERNYPKSYEAFKNALSHRN